jgi:hypothetical protein
MGDICGSVEMRYNSAHSSPACELYADLRHEDVSDLASNLCFAASTVASVTRMANSLARHARLPRVHVKGAVCMTTFTKAKGSLATQRRAWDGNTTPRRPDVAGTSPATHRVHAAVNIQACFGMFPSPGVGGREGRREREVRQHAVSTYRHVEPEIKRCII